MKNSKAICILGGMGPEASIYMYKLLIEFSILNFGAKNNNDFPKVILHSVPISDFIANIKNKTKALQMLKEAVIELNKTNISYLAIACNTAHILLDELQEVSRVPFISMIGETIKEVKNIGLKKVGLLATPSTIRSKLYQSGLKSFGIQAVIPSEKDLLVLEKVIRNVIKGEIIKSDTEKLLIIANSLNKKGGEGIILGCTELPLVFPEKYSLPVYNSVAITAMALLRNYYKNFKEVRYK